MLSLSPEAIAPLSVIVLAGIAGGIVLGAVLAIGVFLWG
jgi:hypothetical protein